MVTTPEVQICSKLDWDSTFFGFGIAKVDSLGLSQAQSAQIDMYCIQNEISCIYFLCDPNDAESIITAETNGFHLVDIRVTFETRFSSQPNMPEKPNEAAIIRFVEPGDTDALAAIARRNHKDTRFHFDAHFPHFLSDELYATWIRRSCSGYADAVLVAEYGKALVGYISCHIDPQKDMGRIGLVGVDSCMHGKGIGRMLVYRAIMWFREQGVPVITVNTQARNVAAQRLYQRCGFVTSAVALWYHKWY